MIFKKIKNLPDLKVLTDTHHLLGYITERKDGWLFKPLDPEYIGLTYDKTETQAKIRAEIYAEMYAISLKYLTKSE